MGNFKFLELDARVYPPTDLPLVTNTPPVVPGDDDDPAPTTRPPLWLLWLGVITCIYIGARAIGVLVNWQPVATPVCVAAWLLVCGLAIFRAWRIAR